METAALISSILSIILTIVIGAFAIWLSVTFYKMSNKISEDTKDAAKGISASVERLETLFDSLYSDTFSMMKDTVTDMRKHVWPAKEQSSEEQKRIEEEANSKIEELKQQMKKELSGIMARVGQTDSKVDDVDKRIDKLIEGVIQRTREVESEAQEEKSSSKAAGAIEFFVKSVREATVGQIITTFKGFYGILNCMVALSKLAKEDKIYVGGSLENYRTIIKYNAKTE